MEVMRKFYFCHTVLIMENLLHSINFELSLSDSNEAVGKLNRRKSENFKTSRKRDDDKPLLVKNIGVRFVNDDLDQSDEELSTLSQQRSLITGVVQPKTLYEEEEQQYQSAQKIMKRSRSEMIFYKGLPKERVLYFQNYNLFYVINTLNLKRKILDQFHSKHLQ